MFRLPDLDVEVPPRSESLLRRSITVYVNVFEQLTYLRNTLHWFAAHGFSRVVVLDQASSYPPLLEYFESEEFMRMAVVCRLERNVGPRSALDDLPAWFRDQTTYIFSDPDLELPDPPAADFVTRLVTLGLRHNARKVGLALDISRPDLFHERRVKQSKYRPPEPVADWESQFWEKQVEPNVFSAAVDTTFHIFNPRARLSPVQWQRRLRGRSYRYRELRVAGPGFVARHLPWYKDDGCPSEERTYYMQRAAAWSNWVDA